jgi:hypothetical protein
MPVGVGIPFLKYSTSFLFVFVFPLEYRELESSLVTKKKTTSPPTPYVHLSESRVQI